MIRFDLKCSADHHFDSWFQSGAGFETLRATGMLTCPTCGSTQVEKALMAPPLAKTVKGPLHSKETDAEKALAKMRHEVETTSDYVGLQFASEARKMHDGDSPERPIYGEARAEDARKLLEDGIPVLPLPFMPKRNTN
ncbi:MAG: hypothetical protein COB65_10075 [Thalassobium sp.]|uniref:DUF1178 family protein n=1 Tax=Octadecabacter sp. SW4 TaxID=2602067 RepID=UPI000C0E97E0|nr:DUF1178 family protein [Octadecabacter sp. SW4]PHQ81528.1 MAG: hypothetical protein COB65_10075 [Thalassobium sp.]QEE36343.1 DUF1178 family protein [Octadecabacter sp. SW4]|tara:strand:- start:126 stop:539 length:414 start_codon:yes stop_codon:yes gene_type:complete